MLYPDRRGADESKKYIGPGVVAASSKAEMADLHPSLYQNGAVCGLCFIG